MKRRQNNFWLGWLTSKMLAAPLCLAAQMATGGGRPGSLQAEDFPSREKRRRLLAAPLRSPQTLLTGCSVVFRNLALSLAGQYKCSAVPRRLRVLSVILARVACLGALGGAGAPDRKSLRMPSRIEPRWRRSREARRTPVATAKIFGSSSGKPLRHPDRLRSRRFSWVRATLPMRSRLFVRTNRFWQRPSAVARPRHISDPGRVRFTPPVVFFSAVWAAVRGVRSLKRMFARHCRRLPMLSP